MKISQRSKCSLVSAGVSLWFFVYQVPSASASGFGLYEASSAAYALGGAVVGRAYDASANFYNPATLTDLTNLTVTAGVMTEHPRARMKTNTPGGHTSNMNPGCFCLPHLHLAAPLPWDLTFGLGIMPEYGLGSKYDETWDLAFNSTETTVKSFTVNPNLAYKVTDRWSVGAGLRFLWFDFEQYSRPSAVPGTAAFENRLKGDNDMRDFGYQIGTKYDLLDNLALGLNYKSETRVRVEGKSVNTGVPSFLAGNPLLQSGAADTILHLPQSLTAGVNWDISEDWHLGGAVAWTDWSSVSTLNFHLPNQIKNIRLNWEDTWRFAIAPSWDFTEGWTWMSSYVFETDCCGSQDSTMLPPSERHMVSTGLAWHILPNLEIDLTYGVILMDGAESNCTQYPGAPWATTYRYSAHRALSHAAGMTLTYRF